MSMRALLGVPSALGGQKRALHPLDLELQMVSGTMWVLGNPANLGPQQEQQALITTEPSFLSKFLILMLSIFANFLL